MGNLSLVGFSLSDGFRSLKVFLCDFFKLLFLLFIEFAFVFEDFQICVILLRILSLGCFSCLYGYGSLLTAQGVDFLRGLTFGLCFLDSVVHLLVVCVERDI